MADRPDAGMIVLVKEKSLTKPWCSDWRKHCPSGRGGLEVGCRGSLTNPAPLPSTVLAQTSSLKGLSCDIDLLPEGPAVDCWYRYGTVLVHIDSFSCWKSDGNVKIG